MDSKSLDEIMSERGSAAPVETTEQVTETAAEQSARERDEAGRFKAKEQQAEPAGDTAAEHDEGTEQATVPHQALHAAREQAKQERERNDRLEREMAEMRGQMSVLTRPAAKAPEEPAQKKEIWDDPDGWVQGRLEPIEQQLMRRHIDTSRMLAEDKFGEESVKAADDALGVLFRTNPAEAQSIAQRMAASAHPFRDLVKWHERQQLEAEIADPEAYRKKVRAEIEAELRGAQQADTSTKQPAAPAAMPSNFAGARSEGSRARPAWTGPKPLSEIMGNR